MCNGWRGAHAVKLNAKLSCMAVTKASGRLLYSCCISEALTSPLEAARTFIEVRSMSRNEEARALTYQDLFAEYILHRVCIKLY